MTFYARMQTTANRLLFGKGQQVSISHVIPGTYDPTTGGLTGGSTSVQTGTGAVFEYGNKNIDGTLIKVGDKQLLLSALKTDGTELVPPVVNDTVTIGGTVYTITQIKPLSPAGTIVLFDANLRGVA